MTTPAMMVPQMLSNGFMDSLSCCLVRRPVRKGGLARGSYRQRAGMASAPAGSAPRTPPPAPGTARGCWPGNLTNFLLRTPIHAL